MNGRLEKLLPVEERKAIRAPIEKARTLPSIAYTSPGFLDLEKEKIFAAKWVGLYFDTHVRERGHLLPINLVDIPLFIVRGDDDVVRVFHNICPYDGCPAVMYPQQGAKEIRVKYHGWIYDLRGKLKAIPYWDGYENAKLSSLGGINGDLVEVRSAVRFGVIFVNLNSDDTSDIDNQLKPFQTLFASEYDFNKMAPLVTGSVTGNQVERRLGCNWKTYIENTCINVLHEGHTHVGYRLSGDVPRAKNGKKTFFTPIDGRAMSLAFDLADFAETYPRMHLPHLGHGDKLPKTGHFWTFYPNLCGMAVQEMFTTNICMPVTPDETRIHHSYFVNSEAFNEERFQDLMYREMSILNEARSEDAEIVVAVQKARRSPVWQQHFYAPFWDEQHYHFNNLVLADLER